MATINNIMKKLHKNEDLYYDEIIFLLQKYAIWEKERFLLDDNTEQVFTLCKYKDQFILIDWYRGIDNFDNSDFPNQPVLIKEICSEPITQTIHSFYDNNGNIVYYVIDSNTSFNF